MIFKKHYSKLTDISYAKIKWFTKCPWAFRLKYLERVQPIYYDPDIFKVGSIVHDTINEYYMIAPKKPLIYDTLMYTYFRRFDHSLGFDRFAAGKECIIHFSDFEKLRREKNDEFPESEIVVSDDNLYGIIDALFKSPTADNTVIDFKTGKKARINSSYKQQAVIYDILSGCPGRVYFYFLYDNVILEQVVTDSMRKEIYNLRDQILAAVENKDFPPSTSCKRCEFRHCCIKKCS